MLTPRGYKIKKSQETDAQIRQELLARPSGSAGRPSPAPFSLLQESEKYLYLPRAYGHSKFGPPGKVQFAPAEAAPALQFAGALRPVQQQVVDAYLKDLNAGCGGGTICLSVGQGKTCSALFIACALKLKTLVVVNQQFLRDQWRERISQFIPTARVGVMQGSRFDRDCDIVIATVQTMVSRGHALTGFGLTISDETHHISARCFVQAFMRETTRYVLGLTATPERKDGLGHVFQWFIGPIVYRSSLSEQRRDDVVVRVVPMKQRAQKRFDHAGRPDNVAMITDLVNDSERTAEIARIARELLEDRNRCVLVLSERRKLLYDLHDLLAPGMPEADIGLYVGGMKPEQRAFVEDNARLMLASTSFSQEGMDVPRLNTLILATPKSDVIQSTGRIMRTQKGVGPVAPLIIDIADPLFPGAAKKRRAYFKAMAYTIQHANSVKHEHDEPDSITRFAFSARAATSRPPPAS